MAEYRISLRQGDQFNFQATYKAEGVVVDLTGYTAEMVITWPTFRDDRGVMVDAGEVNLTMDALGSDGVIGAHLTAEQTETLPAGKSMRWQLRITSGGDPTTIIAGRAVAEPNLFDLVV